MQYKTIVLALLQQRPEMHEQLRQERKLLTTLEMYAHELRESHLDWMEHLRASPASPNQLRSEALELAIRDLEERLPPVSPAETELSLEEAVRFILSHSSHD